MNSIFWELLRIAIGKQERISRSLSENEWKSLFRQIEKQSVIGVCVYAISKLPAEQQPQEEILSAWKDATAEIYLTNGIMDAYTAKIWKKLTHDGLDAAILKGQGLAPYYGELAKYRQPGDIDIWVKGGFDKVNAYVQSTIPSEITDYHHFHYHVFDSAGIEVELHHRPALMRNPFDNMRLQRWCDTFDKSTFLYLDDKRFAIPSIAFNRIFLIIHAYKHFIFDGIGIRQVMDCYQLLRNTHPDKDEMQTFRDLHLLPFLRAMMWVFAYVFEGCQEEEITEDRFPWMLCKPDAKEGRFLLEEIMQSGNFAQDDSRYHFKHFSKIRFQTKHGFHILTHYPSEILWMPLWLVWHQWWKLSKRLKNMRRTGTLHQ